MSKISTHLLINCDMGEWDAPHLDPKDESIMPLVDLCNIACGGHAGNRSIIQSTIDLAIANNIKIGAHPGFEDRANFGRKYISLSRSKLYKLITNQLETFFSICLSNNVKASHVKAHGALYHACNQNKKEAEVLVEVISKLCPDIKILVASGGELEKLAIQKGIFTLSESFIDRKYNDDLSLLSRAEPDAVIVDVIEATNQYYNLTSGKIVTNSGSILSLNTNTTCIHGDNPNCVDILKSIRHNETI